MQGTEHHILNPSLTSIGINSGPSSLLNSFDDPLCLTPLTIHNQGSCEGSQKIKEINNIGVALGDQEEKCKLKDHHLTLFGSKEQRKNQHQEEEKKDDDLSKALRQVFQYTTSENNASAFCCAQPRYEESKEQRSICIRFGSAENKEEEDIQKSLTDLYGSIRIQSLEYEPKGLYASRTNEESNQRPDHDEKESCIPEGYEPIKFLGGGLHGFVFLVRDKKGSMKAIKLYKRKFESIMSREVSILSMLYQNNKGGEVGVSKIFEKNDYVGVILNAGAATLSDFQDYLRNRGKKLSEGEVAYIGEALIEGFFAIKSIRFCHRDIKPDNIILGLRDLRPEIIDYSLAVCFENIKKPMDLAGSRGYIDPYLFNMEETRNQFNLILEDLFSIGVVLLSLVALDFKPVQEDLDKQVHEQLEKVSREGSSDLLNVLRLLLVPERNKINSPGHVEEHCKQISSALEKIRTESLIKYREDFLQYLLNKEKSHNRQRSSDLFNKVDDTSSGISLGGVPFFKDIFCRYPYTQPRYIETMERNIQCYIQNNESKKVLDAFENILKSLLIREEYETIPKYFRKIGSEFSEPHPLLYSTLGSCLLRQPGQGEEATLVFAKGLALAPDGIVRLILLNNYGTSLILRKIYGSQCRKIFKEIFEFFDTEISKFLHENIDSWLKSEHPHILDLIPNEKGLKYKITLEDRVPECYNPYQGYLSITRDFKQ